MTLENLQMSSVQFWSCSLVMVIVDVLFVFLLSRWITPARFADLKWTLVGSAAVFWSAFAIFVVQVFWDSYYRYFFPAWFHSGGVLIYVPILYALFAFMFHWLAFRAPGKPIIIFCLLGGVESLLEHAWGIVGFKILDIPLLQGTSPASILTFSIPEYVFYWCIVISLAVLVQNGWRRWRSSRRMQTSSG